MAMLNAGGNTTENREIADDEINFVSGGSNANYDLGFGITMNVCDGCYTVKYNGQQVGETGCWI
jgi:hypothetical protein